MSDGVVTLTVLLACIVGSVLVLLGCGWCAIREAQEEKKREQSVTVQKEAWEALGRSSERRDMVTWEQRDNFTGLGELRAKMRQQSTTYTDGKTTWSADGAVLDPVALVRYWTGSLRGAPAVRDVGPATAKAARVAEETRHFFR